MNKILITLLFLLASSVHADTSVSDVVPKNTIWSPAGGVYILENFVKVPSGVTLTIEPGTIVKARRGAMLEIYGVLVVNGENTGKVYFTSIRDDTLDGDTNKDVGGSSPSPTDWHGIVFHAGSVGNISHAEIKYAGEYVGQVGPTTVSRAAIFNLGGSLSLDNVTVSQTPRNDVYQNLGSLVVYQSTFHSSEYAFIFDGGTGLISYSNFDSLGIASNGIDNRSTTTISAINNWWGKDTGPRKNSNEADTHSAVLGQVLYTPWLMAPPGITPPEPEIEIPDPVIIIPGIMGSAYKNGELIIDPILHTYDDLIATLIANGYIEGDDLFTFPYEWRNPNVHTAKLLRDKINEVQSICECPKVDLVAHSMGGLVARQYIQSNDYEDDVDQLIFLGTPHKGAPTAYLQWEGGAFLPAQDPLSVIQKLFIYAEARRKGFVSIFDYVRNRPIESVQELLPTFDYLKDKETNFLRVYPASYPRNIFLETLGVNISSLFNKNISITNIIGNTGSNTIERIRVVPSSTPGLWVYGQPDGFGSSSGDNGLERGLGDDTVTINSASLDNSVTNIIRNSGHRGIVSDSSAIIYKTFTEKDVITIVDDKRFPNVKIVLFQLLSPIDVLITAPDGKKIGKNFETGAVYDEIPLTSYSGYQTDDEYITILNPLDGEYKIEIQGTGNGGGYGVLTSYISDEVSVTKEISGLTEPSQVTVLNVQINNTNPDSLEPEKIVTLEVLLNNIFKAYELGWITDKKLKDKLSKQIQAIVKIEAKIEKVEDKDKQNKDKKIEKLEQKIDKKLANALLIELKGYKKDKLNEQAYNIIKEDLEWLINN